MSAEERQSAMIRNRDAARQARRSSAMAKIQASHAADEASPQVVSSAAPATVVEPPKQTPAPAPKPADVAKPIEAKPAEPAKVADPSPAEDAATQRGLAQVEHQRKRFLDEQAAWKAEVSVREAEIARLRQEAQGKVSSIEELKKLDEAELLDKLGYDDQRLARLSRESYFRTAEGQKKPEAKQAVDEYRQRSTVSAMEQKYEELAKQNADLAAKLEATQKLIFQREYANEWVDGAVKEIPADKPTLFSKLLAKNPKGARTELLAIGGELEKQSNGVAPTAAEVLAEYEKRQRAFLESRGFDVDEMLTPKAAAPAPAAAAAKPAARTLDVGGSTQITRADALPKTREERRNIALAKLRMRQRQTADQVS
jgi:hypothetical protein